MTSRRSLLAALLALPLAAPALAASGDCGCGPKAKPEVRANSYYQLALANADPAVQRRLAEAALRIDPNHAGAKALLESLDSTE